MDSGRVHDFRSLSLRNPRTELAPSVLYDLDVDSGFTAKFAARIHKALNLISGSFDGLNYIRNSVKVVVDMYDGQCASLSWNPNDPILAAYKQAFPDVFSDLDELSAD